ncbi:MAG TPA: beta-ketoacyl-ACP synthase III [Gemmataceae bacterium]|nr:beta-ketoacyl-ACP synthase III [Gemmataceae bacterium]
MSEPLGIALRGTGSCLPARVLSNADFEKRLDTSDAWIQQRTGIRERRVVGPGETTASMALVAARRALEVADLGPQDLDLILCATITPEMLFPSTACFVQAGLGCRPIGAFDLLAACSGFVYALVVGSQFIRNGAYRNVLVIGAETLSRVVDYSDRGSCILFGDGAGAAVLSATRETGRGLHYFRLYADGSHHELLHLPGGGSRYPASADSVARGLHFMKLNGREVYRFAVTRLQELIQEAMTECGLTVADVALVIPHQVNQRIIDSAVRHMNFPPEKVMSNLDRYGNTSAASVPIALDEAIRTGRIGAGDKVLLVAFGGGFTWASAVLTL